MEKYTDIQLMLHQTYNNDDIQQLINKGYYNSLFVKIEKNLIDDIDVQFFVEAFYLFQKFKQKEKIVINNESNLNNIYNFVNTQEDMIFFDDNYEKIEGCSIKNEIKEKYEHIINLSILKIANKCSSFEKEKLKVVNKLFFYFQICKFIIYKIDKINPILKKYKINKKNNNKFRLIFTQINKKNVHRGKF